MSSHKVLAIITAATGDRVIATNEAITHIIDQHFRGIPRDIILETVERVLRDPLEVYKDTNHTNKEYDFFYRLDSGEFIVVIVKIIPDGAFLASMYVTGKKQRTKHKNFKKVKI